MEHARPVLAGEEIDQDQADGCSHPFGHGTAAGFNDGQGEDSTQEDLLKADFVKTDESHVEAIRLNHGVHACHGTEERQKDIRKAGAILWRFPGGRKKKINHGQEQEEMDAPEYPGRRGAEAGGVEVKYSGNDADNQNREIPPPLEPSHEAALQSLKPRRLPGSKEGAGQAIDTTCQFG